jgi:hypothetical protein
MCGGESKSAFDASSSSEPRSRPVGSFNFESGQSDLDLNKMFHDFSNDSCTHSATGRIHSDSA